MRVSHFSPTYEKFRPRNLYAWSHDTKLIHIYLSKKEVLKERFLTDFHIHHGAVRLEGSFSCLEIGKVSAAIFVFNLDLRPLSNHSIFISSFAT